MSLALRFTLLTALILLVPSLARADDAAPVPPPPLSTTGSGASTADDATKPTRWYGYETLAVDGAGLVMLIPAIAPTNGGIQTGFGIATALTYGLGGPIVHFTHGHVLRGFLDLGMRLALPIAIGFVGGMIGADTYQPPSCSPGTAFCGDWFGQLDAEANGILIGGLLGMGGAIALDATVLAREPVGGNGGARESQPVPATFTSRIEPALGLVPERQGGARGTVGLVGTF